MGQPGGGDRVLEVVVVLGDGIRRRVLVNDAGGRQQHHVGPAGGAGGIQERPELVGRRVEELPLRPVQRRPEGRRIAQVESNGGPVRQARGGRPAGTAADVDPLLAEPGEHHSPDASGGTTDKDGHAPDTPTGDRRGPYRPSTGGE